MKILIPVDGSENSNRTLDWATSILHQDNSRFYLLTVLTDSVAPDAKLPEALAVLDEARNRLERAGFTVDKSEYMTGDPIRSICRYAEDENVDQILMGSHGRSGLAKVLLGSVSEGVLEHAKRPVFIYRHHQEQMAGSRLK